MPEAERVADRDHPLAHQQRVAVAEGRHRQAVLRLDLDQRDVGLRVAARDFGVVAAPVQQRDADAVRPVHDVVVREDEALLVDDEARPETLLLEVAVRHLPEEMVEEILLPAERHLAARPPGRLLQPPLERLRGVDVHHELLLLLGDLREIEAGQLRLGRSRSGCRRRRALPIGRGAGGGGQVEP